MLIRIALVFCVSLPAKGQQLQPVQPILSEAYQKMLQKNTPLGNRQADSSINSLKHSSFINDANGYYYSQGSSTQKITVKGNKIKISPYVHKQLVISGTYTGSFTAVSANRQPQLQQEYAQGRSLEGALVWQGAETNEIFSYGPRLSQLEYDGQPYPYDIYGKLVPKGTGKQIQASAYNNSILQQTYEWKQRLVAMAVLRENHVQKYYTKLTVAQSTDQLVIKDNKNSGHTIGFTAGATILKKISLVAGIESHQQHFTNGNRNGFLNRVYQQSLVTPASFSNGQGFTLTNEQRSYSNQHDNPLFLLNKTNPYKYSNQQAQFSAEYKGNKTSFKSIYTAAQTGILNDESYQPGTVFFSAGVNNYRQQENKIKTLINSFNYRSSWRNNWQHTVNASINNNWSSVQVNYPVQPANYHWKRKTTDAAFEYKLHWTSRGSFETGMSLGNNFYSSSTATKMYAWLPTAGVYVIWRRVLQNGYIRLFANTKRLATEPSLTQSYAGISTLEWRTEDAMRFLPGKEVNQFNGLTAESHTSYNAGVEFNYSHWLNFNANVFVTHVKDGIFPTLSATGIVLKNMAGYQNSGIELQLYNRLRLNENYGNFFSNSLSFFLNRNTVTTIASGFENSALAGFSNVHKALVKGQPVGSIVGADYLYDEQRRKIIGADGYPTAGNDLMLIGNPVPDFTMKLTQSLAYKRFSFVVDWEWRKGGDIWNGTRAALDYYGRSASSAKQRNTKNFVFEGVTETGAVNTAPVDFYNPANPVEQNRWVRYGYTGIAKDYIEKGSFIKLNNIAVAYSIPVKKWLRKVEVTAAAGNLFIWTAYKGVDPAQLFYDQPAADGLDFFNLPSLKRYSLTVTVLF